MLPYSEEMDHMYPKTLIDFPRLNISSLNRVDHFREVGESDVFEQSFVKGALSPESCTIYSSFLLLEEFMAAFYKSPGFFSSSSWVGVINSSDRRFAFFGFVSALRMLQDHGASVVVTATKKDSIIFMDYLSILKVLQIPVILKEVKKKDRIPTATPTDHRIFNDIAPTPKIDYDLGRI